jgi:hypothetical protein
MSSENENQKSNVRPLSKTAAVYWTGKPEKCNLCNTPITTNFVDGKVAGYSSWAIMCPECFRDFGIGLGMGRGQLYAKQSDERYMKIEG